MTRARDVANIDGILTTTGDTFYASSGGTPARLGVGSTGQVLSVSGGLPAWATVSTSPTFVGCIMNGDDLVIATSTYTALTFSTEIVDTNGFHSTTSNTSRITIPSGKAGAYQINGSGFWSANATGSRFLQIRVNGTSIMEARCAGDGASGPSQTVNTIWNLAVGDYIELYVYQTSGANRYFNNSSGLGIFSVGYLGA